MSLQLTPKILEGFSSAFLSIRYDSPQPIPPFHKEMWALCCAEHPWVAMAAPRGHAKTTAVTQAYGLAMLLFQVRDYMLLVSDTEGQAIEFLREMKTQIIENEILRSEFQLDRVLKDSESDFICRLKNGYRFRIQARGSEQRLRGLLWNGRRPNLIIGDDLENDEICANSDRRLKFRQWIYNALLPCGSDNCLVRCVGTVLHFDSLLERWMNDESWLTRKFQAHADYDDFTQILWPEKFSEERLRRIRRGYDNQGNSDGYSQEYLNMPITRENAYFSEDDFIDIPDEFEVEGDKTYYAAIDIAVSTTAKSDYTVIGVASMDESGYLDIEHVIRGRWNAMEVIDQMFFIQERYTPDLFIMEKGLIQRSIGPFLKAEMVNRRSYLNVHEIASTKDKSSRARSLQAKKRAGRVRYKKKAGWYPALHQEMLRFPRGQNDDQVDMLALLGQALDSITPVKRDKVDEDEEFALEARKARLFRGQSNVTGY